MFDVWSTVRQAGLTELTRAPLSSAIGPDKRALKQFGATCEPVRKFLVDHRMTRAETALSFAVFIAEGGLSATIVREPALDSWKAGAQNAELRFAGVEFAQQRGFLKVVTENLSELNLCRAKAIDR